MPLNDCFDNLQSGFAFVNRTITLASTKFKNAEDLDVKRFIIESAFLKMFMLWEEFLEKSFLCYINSDTSMLTPPPIVYVSPMDEDHAGRMLIGTQKYVDWANHEIVKRLACLYMENGAPFQSALDSISTELSDLKNIRNRAAHSSSTTDRAFLAVQRRVLSKPSSNLNICDFLMHRHPKVKGKNILEQYQEKLTAAAINISTCS